MKERPILFNTENVRAIQGGRKTHTRRVITEIHPEWYNRPEFGNCMNNINPAIQNHIFGILETYQTDVDETREKFHKCPYGQPGDRLWVRETFTSYNYKPIGESVKTEIAYKADEEYDQVKWKPSIYMPKKYARIWLEITDIRIERLQDITENDVIAEGVKNFKPNDDPSVYIGFKQLLFLMQSWNSINEKRGYGWDVNPWVWVIEFKRIGK